jgi:hypothetical protein
MTDGYEVSLLKLTRISQKSGAKVGGIVKVFVTPKAAFWPAGWKAA